MDILKIKSNIKTDRDFNVDIVKIINYLRKIGFIIKKIKYNFKEKKDTVQIYIKCYVREEFLHIQFTKDLIYSIANSCNKNGVTDDYIRNYIVNNFDKELFDKSIIDIYDSKVCFDNLLSGNYDMNISLEHNKI